MSNRCYGPAIMATAPIASGAEALGVCRRLVLRTNPRGAKAECVFTDGTSIVLSSFLASFIHSGDEVRFPLALEAAAVKTEIHIRNKMRIPGGQEVFQAEIGYAMQPRKDKRGNLYVLARVTSPSLGVSAVHLRCETLRDYFYAGRRNCAFDRQPSFYELLWSTPSASLTELRLAFRLRSLELRAARTSSRDLATLERAFNILGRPELRACYDALLADPTVPALFPYGGFGCLLAAGELSRDGTTFYVSRMLSFLPQQKTQHIRASFRRFAFYDDHAVYQDSRSKVEILVDQASLPITWNSGWNQWKHLLSSKLNVRAMFVQSGKYRQRAGEWQLLKWNTAVPSRTEVTFPSTITEDVNEARKTHHRFGQFATALDEVRARVQTVPIEKGDLESFCVALGMPADFDVGLITWKPDYDAFYYRQLRRRSRCLYLFRSEYIFDLESAVIVETPQLGHATYLFSKPTALTEFLSVYCALTKDDIRHNRNNAAERLGFSGRLIHGRNPQAWLKELRIRLGEKIDYPTSEAVRQPDAATKPAIGKIK
jgi:hypothetical protein